MKQTRKEYLADLRKRRLTLAKRYRAGEPVAQIASSLGISRQAVHRAIRNAK